MIERAVYRARRRADGTVAALASVVAPWSPRSEEQVIDDIVSNRCRYVVHWPTGTVVVRVVASSLDAPGPDGRPGGLAQLPRC